MSVYYFIAASFLLSAPALALLPNAQNISTWRLDTVPSRLRSGRVQSVTPMKCVLKTAGRRVDYRGDVSLIVLSNGIKAVFKSSEGDGSGPARAEVAAYNASKVLGFPHIPPTIIRTINGHLGSMQLFVETSVDALAPGVYARALKDAGEKARTDLRIFYFVFGQWDWGEANVLIKKRRDPRASSQSITSALPAHNMSKIMENSHSSKFPQGLGRTG